MIIHERSWIFTILIWTVFHEYLRYLTTICKSSHLMDNFHEKPWKAVHINIMIFRESSRTMVVTICQFQPYLTKIHESLHVNSLGMDGGATKKFLVIILKEACYSIVPVGISLDVSIFPILAVLQIHFMIFRRSHKSNLSICRPCKFLLYPMKPRKISSWTQGDGILTIWDRLRQRMLRSPKSNCILPP